MSRSKAALCDVGLRMRWWDVSRDCKTSGVEVNRENATTEPFYVIEYTTESCHMKSKSDPLLSVSSLESLPGTKPRKALAENVGPSVIGRNDKAAHTPDKLDP